MVYGYGYRWVFGGWVPFGWVVFLDAPGIPIPENRIKVDGDIIGGGLVGLGCLGINLNHLPASRFEGKNETTEFPGKGKTRCSPRRFRASY